MQILRPTKYADDPKWVRAIRPVEFRLGHLVVRHSGPVRIIRYTQGGMLVSYAGITGFLPYSDAEPARVAA